MPETVIVKQFQPSFFSKDGGLIQVTLKLVGESSAGGASLAFDSLREAMRAKYGDELSSDEKYLPSFGSMSSMAGRRHGYPAKRISRSSSLHRGMASHR